METAMKELSSEARALIRRVGTADGPVPSDRARVKRRIVAALAGAGTTLGGSGVAAGAPVVALGATAGSKVTLASVALWLATGAGLGAAVSTPAVVSAYRRAEAVRAPVAAPALASQAKRSEPARQPLTSVERAAAATEAPAAPTAGEAPPEPARAEVERRAPSAEVSRDARRASPNAPITPANPAEAPATPSASASPVASTGATSLAEETRLLHAAQRELARKNTSAALALLDEHAARFPRGALAQERSAARVLALCDLGRAAEARGAAEAFVRAAPQSPLVPRLRGSCALSEPGETDARP
jgi:hypothetical protein